MNITVFNVLISVFALVLLAIPGYILGKTKMLPKNASETISVFVLYVAQTLLVVMSFQEKEYSPELGLNMLYVALIAVAIHTVMFIILRIAFIKHGEEDKIKVVKFASVFSNCGFMGFPFLQSLFRTEPSILNETLIYGAVIISVFNLLTWTVGVVIMTGDRKQISAKRIFLNPVIIGVIVGFSSFIVLKKPVLNFFEEGTAGYLIADKIVYVLNLLKETVTPLSMTVIGIRLANVNLKQLFLDKYAYLSTALKLLVMPALCIVAVAFLPISVYVKYTVFFLLSMPSATNTAMFAVRFKKDGDFASVCVLLSTLLCVATVPLTYMLFNVFV